MPISYAGLTRFSGAISLLLISASAIGQQLPEPEDPALIALLSARASAENFISRGEHVAAADALVQSLRECPGQRVELSDAAYGNGQMAAYLFLHVMQEPAAYDYLLNRIEPEKYATDKMLKVLCYIAIGLNDEQKTEFSREASYLSSSDNLVVRAMTRFYLSNPYFYDLQFTTQFAEALGSELPDLELTQVALNLPLYAAQERGDILEIADEINSQTAKSTAFKPWSLQMRTRFIDCASVIKKKSDLSRAEVLEPIFDAIESAPDWRDRHFTLLLMKEEFEGAQGDRIREAARVLAAREENTPDVLQARSLLAVSRSADLIAAPGDEAALTETIAIADTLLLEGVEVTTPERVLWETWAYSIQGCADNLARAGHLEEAARLYTALAARLPGSKFADAATAQLTEINSRLQEDAQ